jgi:hypothetical protein
VSPIANVMMKPPTPGECVWMSYIRFPYGRNRGEGTKRIKALSLACGGEQNIAILVRR